MSTILNLNKVTLIGRFTADPELKKTQTNDKSVVQFSIACNRPYQKDKKQEADFIKCVAWNATAENICKYFHKGDLIYIDGCINVRNYEKDGTKMQAVEVITNSFCFVESKKTESNETFEPVATTDALPF